MTRKRLLKTPADWESFVSALKHEGVDPSTFGDAPESYPAIASCPCHLPWCCWLVKAKDSRVDRNMTPGIILVLAQKENLYLAREACLQMMGNAPHRVLISGPSHESLADLSIPIFYWPNVRKMAEARAEMSSMDGSTESRGFVAISDQILFFTVLAAEHARKHGVAHLMVMEATPESTTKMHPAVRSSVAPKYYARQVFYVERQDPETGEIEVRCTKNRHGSYEPMKKFILTEETFNVIQPVPV